MNDKRHEQTSALLDGELEPDDQLRVIARMTDDDRDALERFGRYRLIGDVMRGECTVLASDLAGRVREALRHEPVVLAPRPRQLPRWLRPVAGVAVAASVAAGAVLVAPQVLNQTGQPGQPLQLAAELPRQAMAPTLVAAGPAVEQAESLVVAGVPAASRWQVLDPDMEDRLNRLVIEHHEFGGRTGINGPVPHIGFVSHGTR